MTENFNIQGAAALSICESLLLCLGDLGLIDDKDVVGILEDAANAHGKENNSEDRHAHHQEVHDLIKQIIKGGNSVRHLK
ncbi:MAG: hypothetical protein RIG26_04950 [Thalassospira sp.]|uniref:hypothetical protein n=1 Tax=Thalassospira sp. TaxID=1912094 RepID=UPI0032EC1B40